MKKYLILVIVLALITVVSVYLYRSGHGNPSYPFIIIGLFTGIMIILGGCELFANGVECLGDRFNLSHATAGSLLAAVGTALPETMIPIIALLSGKAEHKEGIAIGAILGAPFMLSTLALFLLGITVVIHRLLRKRKAPEMNVNLKALGFELRFFLIAMASVLTASLINIKLLNHLLGGLLLLSYGIFILYTMRHETIEGEEYTEHFHFAYFLGCPRSLNWIIGQVLLGLIFIIVGAHLFVEYISIFASKSGIPALVLSLLIAPVATELPEKFNSITWTLRGKDTIAMANITGAMVFQSTIPVSLGLLFTEWRINPQEILNITFAMSMALLLLLSATFKKRIPSSVLITGGVFYLIYIIHVL